MDIARPILEFMFKQLNNNRLSLLSDEMLEGEGAGLAARVAELEVRCARQAEELLCLRSTLADALRRLNALEGRAPTAPTGQRNGAYTGEKFCQLV